MTWTVCADPCYASPRTELRSGLVFAHPILFRLADICQTLGVKAFWTIPRWLVYRQFLVLVKDLSLPLPEPPGRTILYWTTAQDPDIPLLRTINPALAETEIHRRWDEGLECFLAWAEGTPVHYRWYATRKAYLPYLGRTLLLDDGDHLIVEVFTHPSFRGSGLHSTASAWCLHRSQTLGFARSIGIVASWNTPCLRVAWGKAGRVPAGTVGYWKLGPWRSYFVSGEVRLDSGGTLRLDPAPRPSGMPAQGTYRVVHLPS